MTDPREIDTSKIQRNYLKLWYTPLALSPQKAIRHNQTIVFTEANVSWVHNPYENALVITAEIANSLIHRLLVDNGSTANILYWGVY